MNKEGPDAMMLEPDLEEQIYETLLWRGDIIPTTEAGVKLAEEGERFRARNKGRLWREAV